MDTEGGKAVAMLDVLTVWVKGKGRRRLFGFEIEIVIVMKDVMERDRRRRTR